jgi:pimeloyl-ACP methyl ester carboxylesterase
LNNFDLEKYVIGKNGYKVANVNGHKIFYSESKNKEKKHVLFIHGIGASLVGWRDIPDALSENFHTISVDLIGFGGSEKPTTTDYSIKGFSRFILDFLQAIDVKDEKVCIVGHSLGGYIALQFAFENKDLVEKVVLVDPSGKLDGPTPLLSSYRDAANEPNPILKYEKLKKVFEGMYSLSSALLPMVVGMFLDTIEKPGALYAFNYAFDDSTGKGIGSDRLKIIEDTPCLIIWGANDNWISPKEYAEKFLLDLPNARLEIIPDAGHAPFIEKTAIVYERIRTFLTYDKLDR